MLFTCENCGQYRVDQNIDEKNNLLICPECGHQKTFKRMPLFAIGGASGSGKTAVCRQIAGRLNGVVVLDGDILWESSRFTPENASGFYEMWLRLCLNITQSGVFVAVFNAGFGIPENLENCYSRRYFSDVYYLVLYCSDEELEKRLKKRPQWSDGNGGGFIEGMKRFNNYFKNLKSETIHIDKLDTTGISLEETTKLVMNWMQSKIKLSSK
ncbi:Predicted kinase [Caldanaerobius fijiensis DSM 17918]|uniref:Predicted kinase n=1 Tax=Caldanaerobius fijiensis DSM 17918 TaxID=1121256 RepID=A0A1M4Z0I3_9THEO|nr:AAA family ATPase [Caldanaerobius fijiensis]SHF11475.1 Predicted kinase [Caldanaerobius fijiensis DSM 17918]